ncbi:hypothetical protein PoB_006809600 [Plakobranchus ocellatus]|uniref:G-protein coupled receptors family 1 profile domain-containing protein n=1 Tax=Plakobranchus ocellatus TaxID=259542 RepID=A0AAV4DBS1_9GAST|nr:hypothetical protein PoB_006809600 [Plakobranchus ocellatus]
MSEASPQQGDLRFPADLRTDSLATEPSTSPTGKCVRVRSVSSNYAAAAAAADDDDDDDDDGGGGGGGSRAGDDDGDGTFCINFFSRLVSFMVGQAWIMYFNTLSSCIVERFIALNLPTFYNTALHILNTALLASPWAMLAFNFLLFQAGFYEFDAGYECSHHINIIFPTGSMNAGSQSAITIAGIFLCTLVFSIILHNQNSGDVWETNRMLFELRTTKVFLKIAVLSIVFTLPTLLAALYGYNGLTYFEFRLFHLANQISFYKGLSLMIVLISRQEFRKNLVLVFESKENILRNRTTNLLFTQAPGRVASRTKSIVPESQSQGASRTDVSAQEKQKGASGSTLSPYLDQGLVSRDRLRNIQTPEWLQKKEPPKPEWTLTKLLSFEPASLEPASSQPAATVSQTASHESSGI